MLLYNMYGEIWPGEQLELAHAYIIVLYNNNNTKQIDTLSWRHSLSIRVSLRVESFWVNFEILYSTTKTIILVLSSYLMTCFYIQNASETFLTTLNTQNIGPFSMLHTELGHCLFGYKNYYIQLIQKSKPATVERPYSN